MKWYEGRSLCFVIKFYTHKSSTIITVHYTIKWGQLLFHVRDQTCTSKAGRGASSQTTSKMYYPLPGGSYAESVTVARDDGRRGGGQLFMN